MDSFSGLGTRRLLGFRWEAGVTAQVHERLIFNGEETSMACCPPLPFGHARVVASNPGETAPDKHDYIFFSTACWRHYIGTWEIKDSRFFLAKIHGVYKLLGQEPLLADWFTGLLRVPRGKMLGYVHCDFLSVYEEEVRVKIENGVVVGSRVIDNRPRSGPAAKHYEQGQTWRRKGEHEKAIAAFTQAVRLDLDYADAYYLRGLAYEAIADYDRSLADLKNVIQLEPGTIQGRLWDVSGEGIDLDISRVCGSRGLASFQRGDYEAAIPDFDESIRLDRYDTKVDIRLARGRANFVLGRFKEAIDDLRAVALTNPEDEQLRFDIYYRWAHCCRRIASHTQAILNAAVAIRLDPTSPEAHFVRGSAYLDKGEPNRAIMDFTEAIRLHPEWVDSYVERAKAYQALGDEIRAAEDVIKAQQLRS
jgi:tetratricopeptide (TPR) repeat protein